MANAQSMTSQSMRQRQHGGAGKIMALTS